MASSVSVGTPCGACKFLRRKCAQDCLFAPYFCPDQGPERFAAVHKVFGAGNVSKLLLHVPAHHRGDAVLTVEYEAQARLQDPVYGCVAHIQTLQQQVSCLEAQLMQLRAQVAHQNMIQENKMEGQQQWTRASSTSSLSMMPMFLGDQSETTRCMKRAAVSPQSSIESTTSIDGDNITSGSRLEMHEMFMLRQECAKRPRTSSYSRNEWSELQELALKMMKD